MSENLITDINASKAERYQQLIPQIKSLIKDEPSLIANLANVSAALKETFNFFWVGFYLLQDEQLVLGPFQGPIACTRISFGRGVCGTAWKELATQIVPDVDQFPGHIVCSSLSRSEIVVPMMFEGRFAGVLDIDSEKTASFDETDKLYLQQICSMLL